MKPKIRDHYHAHRLSFWLSLIPKLHRQGTTPDVASQHHLLDDHDNPLTYDGIVRQGPVLTAFGKIPVWIIHPLHTITDILERLFRGDGFMGAVTIE